MIKSQKISPATKSWVTAILMFCSYNCRLILSFAFSSRFSNILQQRSLSSFILPSPLAHVHRALSRLDGHTLLAPAATTNFIRAAAIKVGVPTAPITTVMGVASSTAASGSNTDYTSKSAKQSSLSGREIRSVKLLSSPDAKLCDDVDVSITVDGRECEKWRTRQLNLQWYVELEIDIAHLCEQRQLCIIPLNLDNCSINNNDDNMTSTIHVPGDTIAEAIVGKSVESLCNVSALRIWLQNQPDGHRLTSEIVIILQISHGGYENVGDISQLSRLLFGIESDFARPRQWLCYISHHNLSPWDMILYLWIRLNCCVK